MVKVYTKEHIAQMRIKDSPYAGAAHILGYGDKQREWIDGIKDARKAEEKRQKRKKIPGAFLKASGYLGVFFVCHWAFRWWLPRTFTSPQRGCYHETSCNI